MMTLQSLRYGPCDNFLGQEMLIDWMIDWSIGRSVGWLVDGWLVGVGWLGLVGWLIGLVGWLVG